MDMESGKLVSLRPEAIEKQVQYEVEILEERWRLVDAFRDGLITEAELDEAISSLEVEICTPE